MSFKSDLPPAPDFDRLSASAAESAGNRTRVLALIGNLVFVWSNNESLLIYVLMLLLKTDAASAALVFATLNTTRARIDLIQRLARANLHDEMLAGELEALIRRFDKTTRMRNSFNHCMYALNDKGEITHTRSMRVEEGKAGLRFGRQQPLDARRLSAMSEAIAEASRLNRDLWSYLQRLSGFMKRSES